jgi:hypothetical protein
MFTYNFNTSSFVSREKEAQSPAPIVSNQHLVFLVVQNLVENTPCRVAVDSVSDTLRELTVAIQLNKSDGGAATTPNGSFNQARREEPPPPISRKDRAFHKGPQALENRVLFSRERPC